ncbi:hypothetical protein ABE354_22600 [Brevibacillus laterosporus]|uniref:hypothetical protein n=1 Tax=Brevibacillus laterosporus TaxID=1465 RepID=UPI003D1E5E37
MKKIFLIMFSLLLASCSQQITDKPPSEGNKVQTEKPNSASTDQIKEKPILIFTTPKEDTIISNLSITVEGIVEKEGLNYFFYQVEDGHSHLSSGKVVVEKNRTFKTQIKMLDPSNKYGTVNFYADTNNDGVFSVEQDTKDLLGSLHFVFDDSLVKTNS